MSQVYGWMGTILRVDLSAGVVAREPFSEELRTGFLGGYGIGTRVLYDETGPQTSPLGPDNRLIISAGPLTGTLAFGSSRTSVVFKSPLTDVIGYTSGGGHFAPELKYAGYDAIVVQGRAPQPVYLWIEDDRVEIRDARHLWGKMASETLELLQDVHGPDIRTIGIGPAGESMVKYACLVTDDLRTPGSVGAGCVMGSKNLKVIAIKGTGTIRIAHPDAVFNIEKEALASMKKRLRYEEAHKYGTTTLIAGMGAGGSLPVRNYRYSSESPTFGREQWQRLKHDYIVDNYPHKWVSCFGCPVRCSAWVDLDDRFGKYACKSGRPEGGTLLCGTNLEINNYAAIVRWNELCDQYGMDTFEAASAIGSAMEWYEKGIITREDNDGKEVKFGDIDAVFELTHKIARREGLGNVLAEGVVKGGKAVGATEETTPHGKGKCGDHGQIAGDAVLQLGFAVAPRGWDHLSGTFNAGFSGMPTVSRWVKIYEKEGIPADTTIPHPGRAILTIIMEDETKMANLLGTCVFNGVFKLNYDKDDGDMPYYATVLSAVTGVDFDAERLIRISQAFTSLQKAYNVKLGLGRKDDQVHVRFREPLSGPLKRAKWSQDGFDIMLSRYYELHGWDPETGIPRRDTLEELGLKDVADDLERNGIRLGEDGHKFNINDISLDMRGIKS
ncbi:MAG: aldehyde ferredoxin oxidoreductase family protein [Chloroflexi bacterium]|nr:aldehyde ferredoxin oxidoreductase family protein [Chloroflexota bacterium]